MVLLLFLLLPGIVCCDIKQQLFAVHATDELPNDGILHAGYGRDSPGHLVGVRTTVHFSLGELVRPIGKWKSWEDKKYALVTPLKTLLPQLVNLNCYDSFIVGDLELTDEVFVVVPVGEFSLSPCRMYEYDATVMTLRQAVDQLIASQNGSKVTMSDSNLDEGYFSAYVDGENINTHNFFSPLFQEFPYLSLGVRWEEMHGEAWRFAALEMCLLQVLEHPEHVQDYTWRQIEEHIAVIKRVYLDDPAFSSRSKEALVQLVELCQQALLSQ